MKFTTWMLGIASTIIMTSQVIAAPKYDHYLFKYENGQRYDIKLTENTVTWESLAGADKGLKETDHIQRKNLASHIEIIQWTENDGSFVTVVFDRQHLKLVSSGKISVDTWLLAGEAEILN